MIIKGRKSCETKNQYGKREAGFFLYTMRAIKKGVSDSEEKEEKKKEV